MALRPTIQPRDRITVGHTECIIANVYPEGDAGGDAEVVFNPTKPTNDDVRWTGGKWEFCDRAGYADRYPRLAEYVALLKVRARGR